MKKAVGIIAEYNPFHKGHAYHIEKAKELTGADYAVVVLSGDFVQRGTPAVFSKHLRTKMALLGGADVVLELPSYYASSSAEYFAKGSIGILNALHGIDFLCFGSESGELSPCMATAEILSKEPEAFQISLKENLKKGLSFPSARKAALLEYGAKFLSGPWNNEFLDTPNNILGVEYCKALLSLKSSIRPVTLKREGSAYHAEKLENSYPSASAVRRSLSQLQDTDSREFLPALLSLFTRTQPEMVASLPHNLTKEDMMTEDDFSLLLKYKLMRSTPDSLCQYADMSPELARRICNRLNEFMSFSQFAGLLKTKELTRTRINRALLHTLLEIPADLPSHAPGYVRMLGFQKKSSEFLRLLQNNSTIPVLTKAADYKKRLPKEEISAFETDIFVSNLYQSVLHIKKQTAFVHDLQKPPVLL